MTRIAHEPETVTSTSPAPTSGGRSGLLRLALATLAGLTVTTQVLVAVWHEAPPLGIPWWTYGPVRVYPPYNAILWVVRYHRQPGAEGGLILAAFVGSAVFLLAMALLFLLPRHRARRPSTAHGTAQWGAGDVLRQPTGLLLGRLATTSLRYAGHGHLLTVAPTRAGKGVSAVLPNLLTYPGSIVVTDPKGENCIVSAQQRSALGNTVLALDPFDVLDHLDSRMSVTRATLNPLDLLAVGSLDIVDDARMLADMLVSVDSARHQSGEQAFWNEEARSLLAGLILHVAVNRPLAQRHLAHVRQLLTLPPEEFAALLQEMRSSLAVDGLIARAATRLQQKAEKERSGVISSAQNHTHFLDSPRMRTVLRESTVDLTSLVTTPTTLYLILPPDRLSTYHRWIRLILGCCFITLTRIQPQKRRHPRFLFLLDEFAHLGHLAPVEQAMTLVAGYGASVWVLLQDFAQLKHLYGERWQSFVSNADVLQAFGVADQDTAEYLSKLTGDATIHVASENQSRSISQGKSGGRQTSAAHTMSERARRLLLPDEVRRIPATHQLLIVRGCDPILAERMTIWQPELRGLAAPNPYHTHTP